MSPNFALEFISKGYLLLLLLIGNSESKATNWRDLGRRALGMPTLQQQRAILEANLHLAAPGQLAKVEYVNGRSQYAPFTIGVVKQVDHTNKFILVGVMQIPFSQIAGLSLVRQNERVNLKLDTGSATGVFLRTELKGEIPNQRWVVYVRVDGGSNYESDIRTDRILDMEVLL